MLNESCLPGTAADGAGVCGTLQASRTGLEASGAAPDRQPADPEAAGGGTEQTEGDPGERESSSDGAGELLCVPCS